MVIDTGALLLLSLALLTVPLNWLLAALTASGVHELCHYAMAGLLGGRPEGFRIGSGGAVFTVTGLTAGREALCALAGPLGGLSLLLLAPRFPRLALCAAIQSGFNLLPIYPLDGGRALHSILCLFFRSDTAGMLLRWTEIAVCCVLLAAAAALRLGLLPVFVTTALIIRALSRKIPCKVPLPGVQ